MSQRHTRESGNTARPIQTSLIHCQSMVLSRGLTLMTMIGKVRNMNQQETSNDRPISETALRMNGMLCVFMASLYTLSVEVRPRMPAGRKIRMNTSRPKANTSS